jgi:hypothetical protein
MAERGLVLACAMVLGIQLSSAGSGLDYQYGGAGVSNWIVASAGLGAPIRGVLRLCGGEGGVVRCRIEVRAEDVKPGDTLVVLGGPDALGAWDKNRALVMQSEPGGAPWWSVSVELERGEIEYKFATRSAENWAWEPLPPRMNRKSTVEGLAPQPVFSFAYGDTRPPKPRTAATPVHAADHEGTCVKSDTAMKENGGFLGMFSKKRAPVKRSSTPDWVSKLGAGDDVEKKCGIETAPIDDASAKKTTNSLPAAAGSAPMNGATAKKTPSNLQVSESVSRWRGVGTLVTAVASFSACRGAVSDAASAPITVGPVRLGNSPGNNLASTALDRMSAALQRKDNVAPAAGVASVDAGGGCLKNVGGAFKAIILNLLRLLASPVTVPVWLVYKACCCALGLFFRVAAHILKSALCSSEKCSL